MALQTRSQSRTSSRSAGARRSEARSAHPRPTATSPRAPSSRTSCSICSTAAGSRGPTSTRRSSVAGHRTVPDFRWPDKRLVIEADGRQWHDLGAGARGRRRAPGAPRGRGRTCAARHLEAGDRPPGPDDRARQGGVVARCQAATEAASRISFARTIRSTSARAKRRATRSCSVCSSAALAGHESGRAPDVDVLVAQPVGEVEPAEAAPAGRRAGPSPRPVRRARAPRRPRRRRPPTRPAGTPRSARRPGSRNCSISHTASGSSGTISADGGFSTQPYRPGDPSGSSVTSSWTRIQRFS